MFFFGLTCSYLTWWPSLPHLLPPQVSEVQGLGDSSGLAGAQVSFVPLILHFRFFLLVSLFVFFFTFRVVFIDR